ncbi:MAG: phage major capsid protein, partial [candidate division Zixibacteria bacterium]|nr:phage major capsid protein [Phycisphaerae bacterium]NIR27697.1 phage major capsid protein [Gammaproteobacteria bacterium]NIR68100.1 phage major capsid protein [candidate division Zixibacteria bacterium]NIW98071.1 phage major capsid protein [Phycisphaerae bacterium]
IVFENIVKMYARMWPSGHKNAIWVANPDTFSQLAQLSLTVGTGGAPAYLPANGISGKPYDTLMGKPLLFSEHAQTLG